MTKKIENVFTYMDYRFVLNDDFMARAQGKHNYSLRAYARDLCLSPGFLSDILRGRKHLSSQKGREIFSKLGFSGQALLYCEKLIEMRSEAHGENKTEASDFIQSHYQRPHFHEDASKDLILASPDHLIVYGLSRRLSSLAKVCEFAEMAGLSAARVFEVINDFRNEKYIKVSDSGHIEVADDMFIIKNHALILNLITEVSKRIGDLIVASGGIRVPERVAHALVLGLDGSSYDLVVEAQKHYIKSLHRISEQSKTVDRFVLTSDLLFTLQPVAIA